MSKRKITHDLRVLTSSIDGLDLSISLYGGPNNACGTVRFTFTNPEELHARNLLVGQWELDQTPVALVTDESQIVLIDERRLAERGYV